MARARLPRLPRVRGMCALAACAAAASIALATPRGAVARTTRVGPPGASPTFDDRGLRRGPTKRNNLVAVGASRATAPATAQASSDTGLVFGIYPGGAAGSVNPSGPVLPENPVKRLAALEQLRPANAPFVVHLYADYYGPSGSSAAAEVGQEIRSYYRAGLDIELVLCYRPADENAAVDVPGFTNWTTATIKSMGAELHSLQVSDEANVTGAPDAADGAYPGAEDALIQGVIAAKTAVQQARLSTTVGFNWAYQLDPAESTFWSYLGQKGGAAFRAAVDWVGLDEYPGTWGPQLSATQGLATGTQTDVASALQSLRQTYMPLAGLGQSVPIHVSEIGYPTGPGRTYVNQEAVMASSVDSVESLRVADNITGYLWFDLRDANTASVSFESHYGLMTDAYAPKPAFGLYKQLVAQYSAATPTRRRQKRSKTR